MNNLYIEETRESPQIDFNSQTNILKIKGVSYSENSIAFYKPVFKWLEDYINSLTNEKVAVEFNISYLNTSSTRCMLKILQILENAFSDKKDITINWYYNIENEGLKVLAEEFEEDLLIPFNIVSL